jgi:predicted nucleic acid-binding protein
VILIDTNLLIYAIDADAPQHRQARPWLERTLSGANPVGLPWIVILAFIRITTREGIVRRPLPLADALAYVRSWLARISQARKREGYFEGGWRGETGG